MKNLKIFFQSTEDSLIGKVEKSQKKAVVKNQDSNLTARESSPDSPRMIWYEKPRLAELKDSKECQTLGRDMSTHEDSPTSMASYLTGATYFLPTSNIWSSNTLTRTVVSPPEKFNGHLDQQPACACERFRETLSDDIDSDSDYIQFDPDSLSAIPSTAMTTTKVSIHR
ncbi:hypothetical protein BOTNAR_0695g00020 [Botryotinia narcissicola]|uniref:Uncharacterized protein n=1 Tax=Botryotinia narcissicola TaxID=278944 RepID=A0A4Z1H8F6_9HELO|nr:hypothetical protein BOTNAR_0695g00020 [Botryotinia narcissicola]